MSLGSQFSDSVIQNHERKKNLEKKRKEKKHKYFPEELMEILPGKECFNLKSCKCNAVMDLGERTEGRLSTKI